MKIPLPNIMIFCSLLLAGNLALAGYDLHVTRKKDWADKSGPKITNSEWSEYLKSDKQIKSDKGLGKDGYVVTLASTRFPLFFDPKNGELYTTDPDKIAIEKLIEIAKRLNARVQGDDGEFYPLSK